MTAYQFSQPWLSKIQGQDASTALEFAHLRKYLQGIDDGSISLFNPNFLNATIGGSTGPYLPLSGGTMSGVIAMGSNKITGLAAAASNGDALRYEQLIGAYLPIGGGTLTGNIAFNPTTKGIVGTTTNDSAAAGNVGEYVEGVTSTRTNFAANGTFGDLTSISLTAGDWDVTAFIGVYLNGSTTTSYDFGISTTSGNSSTGLLEYTNFIGGYPPTTTINTGATIPGYRVSLASTTTYYLKYRGNYTVGTPQANGRLSARRVR